MVYSVEERSNEPPGAQLPWSDKRHRRTGLTASWPASAMRCGTGEAFTGHRRRQVRMPFSLGSRHDLSHLGCARYANNRSRPLALAQAMMVGEPSAHSIRCN